MERRQKDVERKTLRERHPQKNRGVLEHHRGLKSSLRLSCEIERPTSFVDRVRGHLVVRRFVVHHLDVHRLVARSFRDF